MSTRKRVLLVEDSDDSREMLAALLHRWEFDVFAYDGCAAAEPHLEACDVEIALLDVRMPGRCGDDFGKALRARCAKTMIVFITGEALLQPLKAAVPDCFVLRKPFDAEVLRQLLASFSSETGHRSPVPKEVDRRAGPGNG